MSNSAMRRKRFTAGVLAAALAVTVMPIFGFSGTASAIEPGSETGDGSVCEDPPAGEDFDDVTDADPGLEHIVCLVNTGVTQGTTDTTYSPNDPVSRRQMALFLARVADAAADAAIGDEITPLPAGDGATDFTDIGDESAETQDAIDRLSDAGIAQGVTPTMFEPGADVSRRQMAKFLVRLQSFLAGEDSLPEPSEDHFDDDNGDSGEAELNILAEEGVFLGDADGNVNAGDPITRRQMAFVLIRKFQVFFENGDIGRLFDEDDSNMAFSVEPATSQVRDTENSPGVVELVFSGLAPGVEHDVYLFPCVYYDEGSQIFSSGRPFVGPDGESRLDGIISFKDEYGGAGGQPDDVPDNEGSTHEGEVEIGLVNFTPVNTSFSDDHLPNPDGTLRITVEGDGDSDCAIPVVAEDPAAVDDDSLLLGDDDEDTLENDNEPMANFGVGPALFFHDGVTENADQPDNDVDGVLPASMFPGILGEGDDVGVIIHDHGDGLVGVDFEADNFFYDGAQVESPISPEQARQYLSITDNFGTCNGEDACNNIDTPYTDTGANNWLFDDSDELPMQPGDVMVEVGDLDGDGEGIEDDLTASWTPGAFGGGLGGDVDEYCIQLYDVNDTAGGVVDSTCTDEVDSVQTGDAPTSIECTSTDCDLEDIPQGVYRARVGADSEANDWSGWGLWSEPFTVLPDDVPPTMTNADLTVDAAGPAIIDSGDTFVLDFSENLAYTDDTGAFRVTDNSDGETYEFDCTLAGIGCTLGDDGDPGTVANTMDRVTVALTVNPTKVGGPLADFILSVPADVTSMSVEFTDGINPVDLAGSTDVTIDNEV